MSSPASLSRKAAKPDKFPYGVLKVTRAEFEVARNIAEGDDCLADAAYQVVRYCRGEPFYRDDVMEYLRMTRSDPARPVHTNMARGG